MTWQEDFWKIGKLTNISMEALSNLSNYCLKCSSVSVLSIIASTDLLICITYISQSKKVRVDNLQCFVSTFYINDMDNSLESIHEFSFE